jgi:hypothetical protein
MKSSKNTGKGLFLFTLLFTFLLSINVSARDYYQLKIYNVENSKQEAMVEKYLKDAYIPALKRAGIKKVGVFKPIKSDANAGKKIIVFIPVKKLDDLVKTESKLAKDARYLNDGTEYINASHDNRPYQRIESILLKAFSEMPKFGVPNHKTPPSERIYEMRSYEGPTEQYYRKKVEMFNEGGEIDLFKRLDFQAVFYGEVISGNTMPNLIYMTTFSDMKSNEEHWDTFRKHPEWKTMSALEKYKNTVSNSVKQLLHPTEYSDI